MKFTLLAKTGDSLSLMVQDENLRELFKVTVTGTTFAVWRVKEDGEGSTLRLLAEAIIANHEPTKPYQDNYEFGRDQRTAEDTLQKTLEWIKRNKI